MKLITTQLMKNILKTSVQQFTRHMSGAKEIKRFYKDVTLSESNGCYEIILDSHKLRTPLGNLVQIPSKPLALGIAEEWRSQEKVIKKFNMHLTTLANICIDRKDTRSKDITINKMLEFLNTDTICFRTEEPIELLHLQTNCWDPLLHWFEKRFDVLIPTTKGLSMPQIPNEAVSKFIQYLKSFDDWALVGYEQAVECLKSFITATAVVNRVVSIEEAVHASCLEVHFQTNVWGTVEWRHMIDEAEMKARLAAAMLFVNYNSFQHNKIEKGLNKHSLH